MLYTAEIKKAYATINDIADWEYYIKGIEPDDNFDFADVTDRNQSDLKIIGNVFEDGDLLNDSE